MNSSEVSFFLMSSTNPGADDFLVSRTRMFGKSSPPTRESSEACAVISHSHPEEIGTNWRLEINADTGTPRRKYRSVTKRVIPGHLRNYLLLACFVSCSSPAQTDSVAIQLGQTEREFAKAAGLKGIKRAFLEYFDDECVIFAPRPTNGKLVYSSGTDSHGSLVWMPTVVEVSASGDFGYTTGPSEYREENSPTVNAHYGHFVSVWRKNHDGQWRVILDVGSPYLKEEKRDEQFWIRQLPLIGRKGEIQSSLGCLTMLSADSTYSAIAGSNGSDGAMERLGAEDVRLCRRGKFPAQGMEAGYRLVRGEKFSGFKFSAGQISSAGDLGFTYGLAVTMNADTNDYIRVWRRENEWKIVLDILKPWGRKD